MLMVALSLFTNTRARLASSCKQLQSITLTNLKRIVNAPTFER